MRKYVSHTVRILQNIYFSPFRLKNFLNLFYLLLLVILIVCMCAFLSGSIFNLVSLKYPSSTR